MTNQNDIARVWEILAAAERQMLEEMSKAGLASYLGGRTTLVEHLHADQRKAVILEHDHGEAVRQAADRGTPEVQLSRYRRGNSQRSEGKEGTRRSHCGSAMMSSLRALV